MDVIIPIKYIQRFYLSKRCKKVHERVLARDCAIHVHDVLDERDFPIAYKVRTYQTVLPKVRDREHAWELVEHGDGGKGIWFTETIRSYKGKLYRPIRHSYGAAIARSFEKPKEYAAHTFSGFQNCCDFRFVGNVTDDPKFDKEKSIVVDDEYLKRLHEVKKYAKQFVVFKGVLWERTEEPLYTYTTFGLGNNHGGTGFFIRYGRQVRSSRKIYWHADEREDAIKAALKVATGRGDTESVPMIKHAKELITKF